MLDLDHIAELNAGDQLLVGLFVLSVLGVIIWFTARNNRTVKDSLCKTCGTVGKPSTVTPGSLIIEAALWICLIVPGVLYSLYRVTKRHKACPNCKSREIIPIDSPIAMKILTETKSTTKAVSIK